MAGRKTATALLSRDAVLAANDAATRDVEVPEWGGSVRVKGLTGVERDRYESQLIVGRGAKRDVNLTNARAKLVVMSVVDAEGAQLFDVADVATLAKKSAIALQRVFDVAAELSGLDEDAMEQLTESLGNDPSADSGSA